jgi:hypothetical protein
MPQLFRSRATSIFRLLLTGAALLVVVVVAGGLWFVRSDWVTGVGREPRQPVPFSHALHSGGLGIDCRYCHTSVERFARAGIPPASTCMTCHAHVWVNTPQLAPVQESYVTGWPILWSRVHRLPDHSFFHHGAHVAAGITCQTCHGAVHEMEVVRQVASLRMTWCVDCHREVERSDPHPLGAAGLLTSCSTCHR